MSLRGPVAAVLIGAVIIGCQGPGVGKTAYVGANIWDGSGAPPILDAVIIVSGAHIEAVGPPDEVDVPRGADVRRLDGKWIIPGLADSHTHVERWMLPQLLAHGVTTVRDMGGDQDSIVRLRDESNLGTILGPRIFMSGSAIDLAPATSPVARAVTSPNDGRRAIDSLVLMEASHATISSRVTRSVMVEMLNEARVLRLPIAAQLGRVDALTAAREGIHSIEHLSGVVEATVTDPSPYFRAHSNFYAGWKMSLRGWGQLDSASLDRTASALAETGVAMTPTLAYLEAFAHLRDQSFIQALDLSGVPQEVQDAWNIGRMVQRAGITSTDFIAFRRARPRQDLFVRRFKAAGGIVVAGSAAPNPLLAPGTSLHHELELLVAAGLSTREALLAATRDAARVLENDTLGLVRTEGIADFVVLNGNPLDDITNIREIYSVIFRGIEYTTDEILSPAEPFDTTTVVPSG